MASVDDSRSADDSARSGGADDIPFEGELLGGGGGDSVEETVGHAPPDVLLDVPELSVDEITLEVENLHAHISLRAEVLQLLQLNVGADVDLGSVSLKITGVQARARLEVRLDRVAQIIDRVLTTIDHNPQILEQVVSAVEPVLGGAGDAAGEIGADAGRAIEELVPDGGEAGGAGSEAEDAGESAPAAAHREPRS
jgi:hypothetical protein